MCPAPRSSIHVSCCAQDRAWERTGDPHAQSSWVRYTLEWHSHDQRLELTAARQDQSEFHYVGKKNIPGIHMKGSSKPN